MFLMLRGRPVGLDLYLAVGEQALHRRGEIYLSKSLAIGPDGESAGGKVARVGMIGNMPPFPGRRAQQGHENPVGVPVVHPG